MKKKNIIKKLLSVALSAATVFSLLTLPAHAIVPGEDAYIGTLNGIECIEVDLINHTERFIPKSDIPDFTGGGTYEALDIETRIRMEKASADIASAPAHQNDGELSPLDVTAGTYTFVKPTQYLYSGVVLLGIFENNKCVDWGTGFLIDEDTVVTALHVFCDWAIDGVSDPSEDDGFYYSFDTSTITTADIRVFVDINEIHYDSINPSDDATKTEACEALETKASISLTSVRYDPMVYTSDGDDDEYDWAIAKLATPITDDVYFWNCSVYNDNTMENVATYHVGYPLQFGLRMVEAYGRVYDSNATAGKTYFNTSSCNEGGMSGGPIYTLAGGVKCCGIGVQKYYGSHYTFAIKIYQRMLNIMTSYMNE